MIGYFVKSKLFIDFAGDCFDNFLHFCYWLLCYYRASAGT